MSGRKVTECARQVKAGEGRVPVRLYDAAMLGRYADIEKIVKEEGGDVNMKAGNGLSCLCVAVSRGHTSIGAPRPLRGECQPLM